MTNQVYRVTRQADSNLVMSHLDGSSQVTTRTSDSSGAAAECVTQPDGNLVIYSPSLNVLGASNTAVPGTYVGNYRLLGQNTLTIMSPTGSGVRALK